MCCSTSPTFKATIPVNTFAKHRTNMVKTTREPPFSASERAACSSTPCSQIHSHAFVNSKAWDKDKDKLQAAQLEKHPSSPSTSPVLRSWLKAKALTLRLVLLQSTIQIFTLNGTGTARNFPMDIVIELSTTLASLFWTFCTVMKKTRENLNAEHRTNMEVIPLKLRSSASQRPILFWTRNYQE
jgi:hypothetical protein